MLNYTPNTERHIVLETIGINKNFKEIKAVSDLNLKVFEGEIFGFLGPNGAGKSTAINIMCGLLKPDSGMIKINSKTISSGNNETKKRVGVCPQNIILWPKLTCFEQLQFVGKIYDVPSKTVKERADKLLTDIELSEKRNKLAYTLSGGMQRRLNVIMALIHDPEIIVLDEPEAGLDPQSKVLVREYIRSMARKKTIILTTHNMDEAERVCDRIAIIDNGKLLLTDTPENLKKTVGKGDLLEIEIISEKNEEISKALEYLINICPDVTSYNNTILLRYKNIISILSDILNLLKSKGIKIGEVRLRENSLEDVFISLTGRRLRE
ncbi:MAG: ABC transporter ATP-binding protein [Bacteroidetes bacterium]|nr:ABC transporter ATP-binding protein [Bacteroidota bacterium]